MYRYRKTRVQDTIIAHYPVFTRLQGPAKEPVDSRLLCLEDRATADPLDILIVAARRAY
jgi:hypothetical protein